MSEHVTHEYKMYSVRTYVAYVTEIYFVRTYVTHETMSCVRTKDTFENV